MEEPPNKEETQGRQAEGERLAAEAEAQRSAEEEARLMAEAELERKKRIVNQVESEMQRRKRLLKFYISLLVAGLLLSAVALIFAKPATEIRTMTDGQFKSVQETIAQNVNDATKNANKQVTDTAAKENDRIINTAKNANANVTEAANTARESVANAGTEASREVAGAADEANYEIINTAKNANASVTDAARRASANIPNLAEQEVKNRIEPTLGLISMIERKQGGIIKLLDPDPTGRFRVFDKYDQGLKGNSESIKELQGTIDSLEKQIAALQQQVNSLKAGGGVGGSRRLSYPVKENSKAQIYELDLKIKLGTQENGVISRIEISSTRNKLINGKASLEVKALDMGKSITFSDGEYTYTLTPIYIQRRRLIKDFIGIAIQRERLIVNSPTIPNAQPINECPE